MALHVMDEANKCLGCPKPRCQQGCPIHTDIPNVIKLLKAGKIDDAGKKLFWNNPLTPVCSLVCDHEHQCEGHCVRGLKGTPVHFSVIENYISTVYANKMDKVLKHTIDKKVAIVGSGPAGLTIAVQLARIGYDITIFEARDKIGGMMRYGIPNFRLPDSVLDDFRYRHLELKDIKIRPNTAIGKTLSIDDLFRDGYKAVFIGAGLMRAKSMGLKGESLGNVAFGIDFLANPKGFKNLGTNIAVIGVGNSAMDCARMAIRRGARHVTCYARKDESSVKASQYEMSYAKIEGVDFRFMKTPVEIREDGLVCVDSVKNEDGTFSVSPGTETLYPHTGVIISVGQGGETFVTDGSKVGRSERGLLAVDENGATSQPGVFAAGDAVAGAKTVVAAVAAAKTVAEAMDRYLQSLPEDEPPRQDLPVFNEPTPDTLGEQII